MKEAWRSNLEYLRDLREDIVRIKDNIERKIEGIEYETLGSDPQSVLSPSRDVRSFVPSRASVTSLGITEKTTEKPKMKVKSRYMNINSKKNLDSEGKNDYKGAQTPQKLTGTYSMQSLDNHQKHMSHTTKKLPGSNQRATSGFSRDSTKGKDGGRSTFMSDQKAHSYVNQLISNFREIHSLKSPKKN